MLVGGLFGIAAHAYTTDTLWAEGREYRSGYWLIQRVNGHEIYMFEDNHVRCYDGSYSSHPLGMWCFERKD